MVKKFDGTLWKWLLDNVISHLLPAATAGDAGKVAKVQADGSVAWGTDEGKELPDYTIANAGEFLAVNEDGDGVEWEDKSALAMLPLAGGSLDEDANITLQGAGKIANTTYNVPTENGDYAQKKYVDDGDATRLALAGGTMDTGATVTINDANSNNIVMKPASVKASYKSRYGSTKINTAELLADDDMPGISIIGYGSSNKTYATNLRSANFTMMLNSDDLITINAANGVYANKEKAPATDYYYTQKKYVDDAIAAAITQLKADNPTLT